MRYQSELPFPTRAFPHRAFSIIASFSVVCCSLSFAEPIPELLDQICSESWVERDQAMLNMIRYADQYPLDELESHLMDPSLNLDQRTRLFNACLNRFRIAPKGGLGVSFGKVRPGGIEIQPIALDPRFPASALLLPGDEIAMIDGKLVVSQLEVRAQILSREPGDSLTTVIIRNDQAIELELELGAFTQLTGAANLDMGIARIAYELRLERKSITLAESQSIGDDITLDQWISAAFPADRTPNPHVPVRRMSTATIAGNNQRTTIGFPYTTTNTRPYSNSNEMRERANMFTQKSLGSERQLSVAHQRVLTMLRDSLLKKREQLSAAEQRDRELLTETESRVSQIEQELSELQTQLEDTKIFTNEKSTSKP